MPKTQLDRLKKMCEQATALRDASHKLSQQLTEKIAAGEKILKPESERKSH